MTNNDDHVHIFVYGTLRRGHHAHASHGLHRAEYLGTHRIPGTMFSLGGFPGVKLDGNQTGILGELYKVPRAFLEALDTYEGYRGAGDPFNLYNRRSVDVGGIEAFVYEFASEPNYDHHMIINDGDWNERLSYG